MLAWLGAVWALFDAGVISVEERHGFYGELQRARHPDMPKRSGDPRAFDLMEQARRRGAEALKEYERHPERLPAVGPWLPDWVLFPSETGRDPELLLVEGFEHRVTLHVRIGDDGAQWWRPPHPPGGPREPPGSAEDELGTPYQLSVGSQSGRMAMLSIRPAPPARAKMLRIQLDEADWSLDLGRGRVLAETRKRAPVYLDAPQLCNEISARRGLRAAQLRLALHPAWRTPSSEAASLDGAIGALRGAGVLTDEPGTNDTAHRNDNLRGGGLQPITRAVYFHQPDTVGVRLLAAFASDCGVMVRWAQLPRVYGPGLPRPWIVTRRTEVRLADDRASPYVAAVQDTTAPGFWDPPFFHGQTVFVTDGTPNPRLFEAAIGDKAAQFGFG
jgi:hypothetical protein